jgi:hypothetical protein
MKKIKDLGIELTGKWLVSFAMYECPFCHSEFKANVNDIKRGRKKHCGCVRLISNTIPLPSEINGIKVVQDLGTINHRRTAIFKCPLCPNEYAAVVSDMKSSKAKKHCGCYVKPKMVKPISPIKEKATTLINQVAIELGISVEEATLLKYTYASMKRRCNSPSHPKFIHYGARGIRVCDEWNKSFIAFAKYIGSKPSPDLSIDRINNNGNYEPGNVRWATMKEQQNNKER